MKNLFFLFVLFCFSVNAQIVNIPDANFKAKLLAATPANGIALNVSGNYSKIDTNSNGEIEISEALNVKGLYLQNSNISSLTGISNFSNLQHLDCSFNQLSSFSSLGLSNLIDLDCNYNHISSLTLSNLPNLTHLIVTYNLLTSLDVTNLNNLRFLMCTGNFLTSLDLSNSINLTNLGCEINQLETLNVNNSPDLYWLHAEENRLVEVFIKNGKNESILYFNGNPNLQYICADESQINDVLELCPSCNVTAYCSFTPGGTYCKIQGNAKFDTGNNGCDASDSSLPNLKFNITDGTISGSLISNLSGDYSIPVHPGTHTITPVFENSSYFNVSPTSVIANFPTQASPFTQNFCITANGVHPDLEVVIVPLILAVPGFDAHYKLIYKNKGNTTQSGTVNLAFNDALLDFVSANPSISNQTGHNLSWNFTNLLPFETREITVIVNVNSPMETPAVNNGDILTYTAGIFSAATDDMPNDNTFALNQTVVNSFDPNDKTCLEGAAITPGKVGDYVHYMIRFENNGTANAHNIVVMDMIDAAKFNVNSIIAIKGSHSFVTKITGNKVEFIFENINLPFDDANNDGYVIFKIKTKPTLVLGNTFSNTASIYFDYNFPIVTNTATTTIAALSRQDFDFSNYFTLYPNPVSDVLNITAKNTIEITSITIYNTLGQLVLTIPKVGSTKTIDVSNLASGNYFIRINSDKGISNTKFVKN